VTVRCKTAMKALFLYTNLCLMLDSLSCSLTSCLCNNAVRLVICKGWHFTHMWKALARRHLFTKKGGLGP